MNSFKEIEKKHNINFLVDISLSISFPLKQKEMTKFYSIFSKLEPEEKYSIFFKHIEYFSENRNMSNMDKNWFTFFIEELNLQHCNNHIINGGNMFLFEYINLSKRSFKAINYLLENTDAIEKELLPDFFDRIKHVSFHENQYDEVLKFLKLIKSKNLQNDETFPIMAHHQLNQILETSNFEQIKIIKHPIMEGINLHTKEYYYHIFKEIESEEPTMIDISQKYQNLIDLSSFFLENKENHLNQWLKKNLSDKLSQAIINFHLIETQYFIYKKKESSNQNELIENMLQAFEIQSKDPILNLLDDYFKDGFLKNNKQSMQTIEKAIQLAINLETHDKKLNKLKI